MRVAVNNQLFPIPTSSPSVFPHCKILSEPNMNAYTPALYWPEKGFIWAITPLWRIKNVHMHEVA